MTPPKYISKGTYGCVMRPSTPCSAKSMVDIQSVGKLFINRKDADDEHVSNKIIKDLDPKSEFTIKDLDYCRVESKTFGEEIKRCDWRYVPEHVQQIIYEYGGFTLSTCAKHYHHLTILEKMMPLFKGLVALSKKKLVHADIKPLNILFNPNTKKMVFIDFGMLTKADKVFVPWTKIIMNAEYFYYPPEFPAYYLSHGRKIDLAGNKYIDGQINPYQNFSQFLSKKDVRQTIEQLEWTKFFYSDLMFQLNTYLANPDKKYDPLKVDVFSLGMTLLECILLSTINKQSISIKMRGQLLSLLMKMLHPDPAHRYTAKQALKHFRKICPTCKKNKTRNLLTGRCHKISNGTI
jgi:serine/threonine protein kinase